MALFECLEIILIDVVEPLAAECSAKATNQYRER